MARPRKEFPSVVHHKPTGQARVRIGGKDFYLGRYGSKQARAAYARLIGEVEAVGTEAVAAVRAAIAEPTGPTVSALCLAFVDHAEATYRKNGRLTSTVSTFRTPVRVLRETYGATPAKDFSPVALEAVRSQFVKLGMSRGVVNAYAGHVRRVFRWGVSRQLVPVSVVQALECLNPIRAGRSDARETAPVLPVDDSTVEATLPFLPSVVKAMVRLQRLTGMRPGEVCSIRPADLRVIDKDDDDASERRDKAAEWRDQHCWAPNQLRHTAATAIRKEFGLEGVQAALGHARMDTSQIDAEKAESLGPDVALKLE